MHAFSQLSYVVATALFILSLHWMSDPKSARRGVSSGVVAMVLAVVATWAQPGIIIHHLWIVVAIVAGIAVGWPLSRVPLTAVPQRTALSHAFGGLAAGLIGTAKRRSQRISPLPGSICAIAPTALETYNMPSCTMRLSNGRGALRSAPLEAMCRTQRTE